MMWGEGVGDDRPACVLARVPRLAAHEDQGEEVPLAADLNAVSQLVVQGLAVPN